MGDFLSFVLVELIRLFHGALQLVKKASSSSSSFPSELSLLAERREGIRPVKKWVLFCHW